MSADFDPYYKWLGIPLKDQPPHHYRLLGIELFERDPEVIEAAANRLMSYLHDISSGGESADQAQRLLNEISAARICLLNAKRKAAYDVKLEARLRQSRPPSAVKEPEPPEPHLVPMVIPTAPPATARAARRAPFARGATWLAGTLVGSAFLLILLAVWVVLRMGAGPHRSANQPASTPSAASRSTGAPLLVFDWPVAERAGATLTINGRQAVT